MRIIKEGKKPIKECEVTCGICEARFAYIYSDVQQTPKNVYYVKCPSCGQKILSDLK